MPPVFVRGIAVQREPPFSSEHLEAIAKVLADTAEGLTGSEIAHTLAKCRVQDVDSTNTKWKRLYHAFAAAQGARGDSNHIVGFIHHAMKPVRWSGKRQEFERLRTRLNGPLAFCGLELHEDGCVRRADTVATLTEAERRANRLRSTLEDRNVHSDVLLFCRAELLQENFFHAVLEATKSVANKIRTKTGLTSDGAALARDAFGTGQKGIPVLAINDLSNETEVGEQRGFTNLVVGLFGTLRNPTAHAEKTYWPITEQDALDILSLVSLVHRKLDTARPTNAPSPPPRR